jgi:hypothetical protein
MKSEGLTGSEIVKKYFGVWGSGKEWRGMVHTRRERETRRKRGL